MRGWRMQGWDGVEDPEGLGFCPAHPPLPSKQQGRGSGKARRPQPLGMVSA